MALAIPNEMPKSGGAYRPIPSENHPGICIGFIDLGTHQESSQGGPVKSVRKVKVQFELPGVTRDDGKSAIISAKYNYGFHEKSNFRKMLDSWLGADWSTRLKGKSWEVILNTPAMVNVEHRADRSDPSRVYAFIASISKYPRNFPKIEGSRDTFFLSLDDKRLPKELSVWDAETIRQSKEYMAGGFDDEAPRPEKDRGVGNRQQSPVPPPVASMAPFDELNDDSDDFYVNGQPRF